jgi:hypothetical protein
MIWKLSSLLAMEESNCALSSILNRHFRVLLFEQFSLRVVGIS